MPRSHPLVRGAAALLLACVSLSGHAADLAGPGPLSALVDALPELPSTAAEAAAGWIDKQGRLIEPRLLALQAAIDAHRRATERIAAAFGDSARNQGAVATQDIVKGVADIGIDVQRLQADPAYAASVQQRLQRMSPAEAMALSQRMAQPLNRDARVVNQAQAQADDTAANRAAADAGFAYGQGQQARIAAANAQWQQVDAAVQRILAKPLVVAQRKPAMAWDNIGCDSGCRAQWDAYAGAVLPLMLVREADVLQLRRSALQQLKSRVASDVKTADALLRAAGHGVGSASQLHQQRIVGYDAMALGEVQLLVDRTLAAARTAATAAHCGKQPVLVPQAVCS